MSDMDKALQFLAVVTLVMGVCSILGLLAAGVSKYLDWRDMRKDAMPEPQSDERSSIEQFYRIHRRG